MSCPSCLRTGKKISVRQGCTLAEPHNFRSGQISVSETRHPLADFLVLPLLMLVLRTMTAAPTKKLVKRWLRASLKTAPQGLVTLRVCSPASQPSLTGLMRPPSTKSRAVSKRLPPSARISLTPPRHFTPLVFHSAAHFKRTPPRWASRKFPSPVTIRRKVSNSTRSVFRLPRMNLVTIYLLRKAAPHLSLLAKVRCALTSLSNSTELLFKTMKTHPT